MIYKAKMPEAYARVEWCKEAFGPLEQYRLSRSKTFSDLRWWRKAGYLYFRNEKDYILYTLRWS